jgi:hypothetical protein
VRRVAEDWLAGLARNPASRATPYELADLLPVMESTLGAERPRTVAARRDLASWTEKAAE